MQCIGTDIHGRKYVVDTGTCVNVHAEAICTLGCFGMIINLVMFLVDAENELVPVEVLELKVVSKLGLDPVVFP
jgi:hypothetical protein